MGVDDAARRHNSTVMAAAMKHAEDVREAGRSLAKTCGFHGMSRLFAHLDYLDVRTITVVPFMHAFCQGVLKDLLKALLASPQPRPPGLAGGGLPAAAARGGRGGKRRRADSSASEQQQPAADNGVLAAHLRVKHAARRVIAQRSAAYVLHPQVNRPVRNPVKHCAGLHMDELSAGVTGLFSPLLWPSGQMQVLHDPVVKKAWGHLRRFACFHLTAREFSSRAEYEAEAAKAQQEIIEYGKLVEQDLDPSKPAEQRTSSLCTFNLHHLACVLHMQALYRGLTVHELELWVERCVGWIKRRSRDRVARDGARLALTEELDSRGLTRASAAAALQLARIANLQGQLPPLILDRDSVAQLIAAPDAVAESSMLGPAQALSAEQWAPFKVGAPRRAGPRLAAREARRPWRPAPQEPARRCLQNHELWSPELERVWDQPAPLGPRVQMFKQATLAGGTLVCGTRYGKLQSRNASRVLIHWCTRHGNEQPSACEVDCFLELQWPRGAGASSSSGGGSGAAEPVARLAIIRQFKLKSRGSDPDIAELLLVAHDEFEAARGSGAPLLRAVPLDAIAAALHGCKDADDGTWLFTTRGTPISARAHLRSPLVATSAYQRLPEPPTGKLGPLSDTSGEVLGQLERAYLHGGEAVQFDTRGLAACLPGRQPAQRQAPRTAAWAIRATVPAACRAGAEPEQQQPPVAGRR
ncbi:hypothetical protein HT031_000622 [Scenedesmus sp. PABB004]|nr:hypothetical protein HT031_000622 [Scenedesmus sp. PABB004]